MRITNVGFVGFKTGVSVPENFELIVEKAYFKDVETCYEIKEVSKKINTQNKNSVIDDELDQDIKKVIQNLHNLEIQSKIDKDFEKLKKVRKLKGLIGSKKFISEYLTLWNKG